MVIVSQLVITVMVLLNGAMLDGVQIVQMVQMKTLTNAAMLVHTQMIYVILLQHVQHIRGHVVVVHGDLKFHGLLT